MSGIGIPELIVLLVLSGVLAAVFILLFIILFKRASRKAVEKNKTEDFMFCPRCGTQNPDAFMKCSKCNRDLQPAKSSEAWQPSVPSYLVQAILVTIFCCIPFGIVAIVYAAQVNEKLARGNYDGAVDSSKKAEIWCWISFGVGIVFVLIFLFLLFIPMIPKITGM